MRANMRQGGKIVADQLVRQGVRRVFSVPGESFLAVLDGLYDSGIQNIVCRHEGGAAMMAEAMGKLTGQPGVAFVTRGPGATNASAGVHIAMQDGTPMVLFIGQIARGHRDRGAFQEVNYRAFLGPLAKWVAEVDQTDRLPEYISRAFHVATSGRPGPVVLALPEDMLSDFADVPDNAPPAPRIDAVAPEAVAAVLQELGRATRPLIIAGGSRWSQDTARDLARFAGAHGVPVAVDFRRQDYIDNRDPAYVGDLGVGMNPRLAERMRTADLLLVLGARLGDIATGGYEVLHPGAPGPRLIHVHPDPDELGSVFRPDLAVVATGPAMVAALACSNAPAFGRGDALLQDARADYEAWNTPRDTPGAVKLERVVRHLSDTLPADAILTNGAGNYAAFVHRYFRFRQHGGLLAPTSGSMGYGFPAAIAAKLEHPDRTVVCFAGDGCFQMTLNELSTAAQHGAAVVVIVANNGRYGTIRMHQERHYPGRISGTDLANPDFAALARAYGGHGEVVEQDADFAGAFDRAVASNKPAVIELRLDREMLTPAQTLTEVRAQALAARG
jgi:acetolactate synthase-1/2/3 large subunit